MHSAKVRENLKVQIKELRENSLVADSAIILFPGFNNQGYALTTEVTFLAKSSLFLQTSVPTPVGH